MPTRRASDKFKRTVVPALLVTILTIAVLFIAIILITEPVPMENKEIVFIVYGALMAKWSDSIAYYLGTTHNSNEKNKFITK